MSSLTLVPPTQAWILTPMYSPMEWMTNAICRDSSLVGATIKPWVWVEAGSMTCRVEIVKAPVLPVPDWAYFISSWLKMTLIQNTIFIIRFKKTYLSDGVVALNNGQDTFLLDWRGLVETISVNSSQNLLSKTHVIKPINWFIPIWLQVFFICSHTDGQNSKSHLPSSSFCFCSSSFSGVSSTGVEFWFLYGT